MASISDARGFQVAAVLLCQHLRDHHAVVHDLQEHGNAGVRPQQSPASDELAIGDLQVAAQRPILRDALTDLLGAGPKPALDRRKCLAGLDNRGAKFPLLRCGVRIKFQDLGRVVEHPAVVAINIGLGRGALGVDHVVRRQLDVEIADRIDIACHHDGYAVHQLTGRHQNAIEVKRVLGRDMKIALRHTVGQRAGADQHWREVQVGGGEGARIAAPSDPLDRPWLAVARNHQIADCQRLDGLFTGISKDAGTLEIAGDNRATAAVIG